MQLIKIIFLGAFLLLASPSYAQMGVSDYEKVSAQFKNRGWDLYASDNIRRSHFLDFGNSELLAKLRSLFKKLSEDFIAISEKDYDYQDLNIFYPEFYFASNNEVVSQSMNYSNNLELYKIISSWTDLFSALNVENWRDSEGCSANINQCGRETKVNYILQGLPSSRKEKLEILKASLKNEIFYASNSGLNLNFDSNLIRVFQFLNDKNIFSVLIDSRFFNSGSDVNERKKLFIEGTRVILMQVFKESGGRILTSDSILVSVEPLDCDLDCMYSYYKKMMYYNGEVTNNEIANLIFDKKLVSPILNYYLSIKADSDKKIFLNKLYFFLKDVLGLDVQSTELDYSEKEKIVYFLNNCVDYLLRNPSVESLKIAKEIEYYLKELNNE